VTGAESKQFRGYLEHAATAGRPLLVEDIDEPFDATVSRLAGLICIQRGGQWCVKVGDKQIRAADGFRLYMTTKLTYPQLRHYTRTFHVNVIDFTLSHTAVADQLLACVFQHDKPVIKSQCSTVVLTLL